MPEQTLSPEDFEFTAAGELVVHWRTAANRTGEFHDEAREPSTSAQQPTPEGAGSTRSDDG